VSATGEPHDWRRSLRREVSWLLVAKLGALLLLWLFFFAPAHRPSADSTDIARRLSVVEPAPIAPSE
jgi:hypothetical protein